MRLAALTKCIADCYRVEACGDYPGGANKVDTLCAWARSHHYPDVQEWRRFAQAEPVAVPDGVAAGQIVRIARENTALGMADMVTIVGRFTRSGDYDYDSAGNPTSTMVAPLISP